MKNRLRYDAAGDEEDYVKKCMTCKRSYTRQDEADTLFCFSRNGCKYEKYEEVENSKECE